jgi:hypothetical protein
MRSEKSKSLKETLIQDEMDFEMRKGIVDMGHKIRFDDLNELILDVHLSQDCDIISSLRCWTYLLDEDQSMTIAS